MEEIILDCQGFCVPDFVVKEVALLSIDGKLTAHLLVKPPFPWKQLSKAAKKQINWLRDNHHGFSWEDGFVTYEDMKDIITRIFNSTSKIYVKGEIKKKFVEKYFSGLVEDLSNLPAMKKHSNQKSCFFHKHHACSINYCYIIKMLLDKKINQLM